MIRRSEHTFTTFTATTGRLDIRQCHVCNAAMCLCLDNLNYQPKPGDLDRSQQLD